MRDVDRAAQGFSESDGRLGFGPAPAIHVERQADHDLAHLVLAHELAHGRQIPFATLALERGERGGNHTRRVDLDSV